MGILKGCGKLVGSALLGATGVASAVLGVVASAAGMEEAADMIGRVQNASFDKIQDMWTPDEKKTDEYYEKRMDKHEERAQTTARMGAEKRREYEKMKERSGSNEYETI